MCPRRDLTRLDSQGELTQHSTVRAASSPQTRPSLGPIRIKAGGGSLSAAAAAAAESAPPAADPATSIAAAASVGTAPASGAHCVPAQR